MIRTFLLSMFAVVVMTSTSAQAQDPHSVPMYSLTLPEGCRARIKVEFIDCPQENLLLITDLKKGRLRQFNRYFGERWPIEAPAGGGEWQSEVATEPTVLYLTGQYKNSGYDGGAGRPWLLSGKPHIWPVDEKTTILGFPDNHGSNPNDIQVTITLERVKPAK